MAWIDKELWAPCFQANVVGTTGSGDATIAGFLGALLRDLSAEEATTAAVAVGACNVEAADALSGIRSWDETWQRVRSGWTRHELALNTLGWILDEQLQLRVGCDDRPGWTSRAGIRSGCLAAQRFAHSKTISKT